MIITGLILLCTEAFGQPVQVSGWNLSPRLSNSNKPDKPEKPDPEIETCRNTVIEINNKNKLSNHVGNLCSEKSSRKKINKAAKEISLCVDAIANKSNHRYHLVSVCFDEEIMAGSIENNYLTCLTETNKFNLGQDQFRACLKSDVQDKVKNPELTSCFDAYRAGYPTARSIDQLNWCRDSRNLDNILSRAYEECHTTLSKLGSESLRTVPFCLEIKNQAEKHLNNLESCTKNLPQVINQPGLHLCLELNDSLQFLDKKNLNCITDLQANYLDKSYFSDDNPVNGAKLIKNFLNHCYRPIKYRPLDNSKIGFIGMKVINTNKTYEKSKVGGLSALVYDKKSNSLLAVSDDPGFRNPTRLYHLTTDFTKDDVLSLTGVTYLNSIVKDNREEKKDPIPKIYNIDAEGITLLPNSDLVVSSETLLPHSKSFIRIYDREGRQKNEIILSDKYIPTIGDVEVEEKVQVWKTDRRGKNGHYENTIQKVIKKMQVKGLQMNKAFEALTSIPGTHVLLTANEYPLSQDEMKEDKIVRISRLVPDASGNYVADAEFAYPLSDGEDNGLVELVAIDENRILTLERRFDPKRQKITGKIYEIDLSKGKNYIETPSFRDEVDPPKPKSVCKTEKDPKQDQKLKDENDFKDNQDKKPECVEPPTPKGRDIDTLDKRLVVDLEDLTRYMPEGLRKIDNFEGMALGPKLPNGARSLILATDNNFSAWQLTQLLILEINF